MDKTNGAVSLLNLTAQAGLTNLQNIGANVQSTGDISFKDTFMKTSQVNPVEELKTDIAPKKTVVENVKTAVNNKNIKSADTTTEDKKSLDENGINEIKEEVSKASNEIKDKIKEQFSVSDEDIEEAMEVLGMTNADLFNATDLRSLMMELTGTTDSIELLTNVELYNGIKEVTELSENLFSEVSEKLNIPQDALAEIIDTDSFKQVLESAETNVLDINESENTVAETEKPSSEEEKTVNTEAEVVSTEIINQKSTDTTTADVEVDDDAVKAITENTTDTADTIKTTDKSESAEKEPVEVTVEIEKSEGIRTSNPVDTESFNKDNDSANQNQNSKKQNIFDNSKGQEVNLSANQTVTTQTVNSVGDIVETVTSYSSYADTENIMRQVTDYVKVNITEDVTKMEMQLHPASLGTVNMQINSQNGQITAHLTVQNELVKSVLESQMIKLQETFNEQGTKVTAIEVTVTNYNLDSKSDNNYSQERDRNQGSSKRRSINLNEIGSFDELTDEELLEAEVMEMNGSSVNYTA